MTLQARIKQLEAEQDAKDSHPVDCICALIIIGGEATPEQQAALARNRACRAGHADKGFSVVEVPPMPEWMKNGEEHPPCEIED